MVLAPCPGTTEHVEKRWASFGGLDVSRHRRPGLYHAYSTALLLRLRKNITMWFWRTPCIRAASVSSRYASPTIFEGHAVNFGVVPVDANHRGAERENVKTVGLTLPFTVKVYTEGSSQRLSGWLS
jgi:hypothetical protein